VAIPYVRKVYGAQFSILQLNSVVLILHLSLAELLITVVSIPAAFLLLKDGEFDQQLCFYSGLMNLSVLYVDINTVALISCSVARHNLCSTCQGASLSHDGHDNIFGGKKVYLTCVYIWIISALTMLPEFMEGPGSITPSNAGPSHLCDFNCPTGGCLKIFPLLGIINNVFFMSMFYTIIIINLFHKKSQVYGEEISDYMEMVTSISRTVSILIFVYILSAIPLIYLISGQWPPTSRISLIIFFISSPITSWLFALHTFIYLTTNHRIRVAYRTFLKDMWKKIFAKKKQNLTCHQTDTSAWWIDLRNIVQK